MTEQQWLECNDPQRMLEFIQGKVSERKLRLFAVGCCRRLRDCVDSASQEIVDVAERYADGLASRKELQRMSSRLGARGGYSSLWAHNNALHAVMNVQSQEAAQGASDFVGNYFYFHTIEGIKGTIVSDHQRAVGAKKDERIIQTFILKDIMGNPFQPVTIDRQWLTPKVVTLAQAIHNERTFERLPILADALEEAGCTNTGTLDHCRSKGEHVRGCWVMDLILGKE